MIFLATDFGRDGPYVGQMRAVLARLAPDVPVIELFSDLPAYDPKPAAYLLAAYVSFLEPGDVLLAVVDPGVGGDRLPLAMHADDRWYVGPDNGLFELIRRRATSVTCEAITWRPECLSASFHGRDLFAPIAAELSLGRAVSGETITPTETPWPDDLATVVYVDHYGNAATGLRAPSVPPSAVIEIGAERLTRARTFSDRPRGEAFWYENAVGLLEIAVNGGSAAERFGLAPGTALSLRRPG